MEVHIVHNIVCVEGWGEGGSREGEEEEGKEGEGREKWGREKWEMEERERKREGVGKGERREGGDCRKLDGSVRLTDCVIKRCLYVCCQ